MAQIMPFIPAIAAAGSIGMQAWQGGVGQRRADAAAEASRMAQKEAMQKWQETSLPDPAVIEAQATQNRGALGQARLGAYQNLSSNLASRGFGSGSGLGIKGAADIESGYLKGLGQMQTELTKFANTRQFAPPAAAWPRYEGPSVPGAMESGLGGASNLLNTALGMYMANQALYNKGLFGGGGQQTQPQTPTNWPGYGDQAYYYKGGV